MTESYLIHQMGQSQLQCLAHPAHQGPFQLPPCQASLACLAFPCSSLRTGSHSSLHNWCDHIEPVMQSLLKKCHFEVHTKHYNKYYITNFITGLPLAHLKSESIWIYKSESLMEHNGAAFSACLPSCPASCPASCSHRTAYMEHQERLEHQQSLVNSELWSMAYHGIRTRRCDLKNMLGGHGRSLITTYYDSSDPVSSVCEAWNKQWSHLQ